MHAAVDGLMLEYRRAALFYGAGCGRLAFCRAFVAGGCDRRLAYGCVARWWQDEYVLPVANALRVAGL